MVVSSLPGPLVGIWQGQPPRLETLLYIGEGHEVVELDLDRSGNFLAVGGWRPNPQDPDFESAYLQLWDLSVLRLLRNQELGSTPVHITSPGTGSMVVNEPGRGHTLYRLEDLARRADPTFWRLPRYGGPALEGVPTVPVNRIEVPALVDSTAGLHAPSWESEAVARDEDLQPVVMTRRGGRVDGRRLWTGAPARGAPALLRPGLLVVPDPVDLHLHGLAYPREPGR